MLQTTTKLNFQVLIEEDKAQGDFSAYIPAFRLGVQGDSLEDVHENAMDLLQMEIDSRVKQGQPIPTDKTAKMVVLSIDVPVL